MSDLYRQKVTQLAEALAQEESRAGAADALRGLVESITLTPDGDELRIELQGNLAAMLRAAEAQNTRGALTVGGLLRNGSRSPNDDDLVQIMMVAGAGFETYVIGLGDISNDVGEVISNDVGEVKTHVDRSGRRSRLS